MTNSQSSSGPTIEMKTFINASPEEIWPLVSSAEGFSRWFTTRMEMDPQPGGNMRFQWENYGPDLISADEPGTVVEMQAPGFLKFTWSNLGRYICTVEFHLVALRDGTEFTVKEYDLPEGDALIEVLVGNGTGWGQAVNMLKNYVEHGVQNDHIIK